MEKFSSGFATLVISILCIKLSHIQKCQKINRSKNVRNWIDKKSQKLTPKCLSKFKKIYADFDELFRFLRFGIFHRFFWHYWTQKIQFPIFYIGVTNIFWYFYASRISKKYLTFLTILESWKILTFLNVTIKLRLRSYTFSILIHFISESTLSTPAEEFRRCQVFASDGPN